MTALSRRTKIFYAFGHVLNDVTLLSWFSYGLFYMTKVAGLTNGQSGTVFVASLVVEALATPFLGWIIDRTRFPFYGKRKLWHLLGAALICLSFPFTFISCFICKSLVDKTVYYAVIGVLFNGGFTAVQISHLSIIPEIATNKSDQIQLNAYRSGMTFLSGLFSYCISWYLLKQIDDTQTAFTILVLILIGVGGVLGLLYHIAITERPSIEGSCFGKTTNNNNDVEKLETKTTLSKQKGSISWFKDITLYRTIFLYTCTRVGVNVFNTFLPLYLSDYLILAKTSIAYFPLKVLCSGVAGSAIAKFIAHRVGSQVTYIIGTGLVTIASIVFCASRQPGLYVTGAAILAGTGMSMLLVTAYSRIAKFIGEEKTSGGCIYSVVVAPAKIFSGIVIFVVQNFQPDSSDIEGPSNYIRYIQAFLPSAFFLCAVLSIAANMTCNRRRKADKSGAKELIKSSSKENSNETVELNVSTNVVA